MLTVLGSDCSAAWTSAAATFAAGGRARSVLLEAAGARAGARTTAIRPGASVLKLPIVLAALEARDVVPASVTPASLAPSRYPSLFDVFAPDHPFSVDELCALVLATSDNRAADLLLALVGLERVNRLVAALGCADTAIRVGFSDEDLGPLGRRNVTTAEDCLRLLRAAEREPRHATVRRGLAANLHNGRIPDRLPDEVAVLHKTGTLAGVVNDIGLIESPVGTIAAIFLCDREPDTGAAAAAISACVADAWSAVVGPPELVTAASG